MGPAIAYDQTFRRTTWRMWSALVFSVAALGFCAWAYCNGRLLWGRILLFLAVSIGCVVKLRRARHQISLTAAGLRDPAVHPHVIPWSAISDVGLAGDDRKGWSLALTLALGEGCRQAAELLIDLDGVEDSPTAVLAAVMDHRDVAALKATHA
jgi:hypothetical protein